MSLSVVRYIELLSVKQQNNTYYLHLIIHSNKATELYMEIDAFTAENLQAQCTFNEGYKYRLSLRALEDMFSNRIYSTVTKTQLTRSERMNFDTSPLYKKNILQIKNCGSLEQLLELPFLFLTSEVQFDLKEEAKNITISQPLEYDHIVKKDLKHPDNQEIVDEQFPSPTNTEMPDKLEVEELSEPEQKVEIESSSISENLELEQQFDAQELEHVNKNEHPNQLPNTIVTEEISETTTPEVENTEQIVRKVEEENETLFVESINSPTTKNVPPVDETVVHNQFPPVNENIVNEKAESIKATVVHEQVEALQPNNTSSSPQDSAKKNRLSSPIALILLLIIVIATIVVVVLQLPDKTKQADEPLVDQATNSNTVTKAFNLEQPYTFSLPSEYAAITFTKGPSTYTEEIVSILEEHNVDATFFLIGKHVTQYPDTVKMLADKQYSIGHATENYTLLTTMPIDQQESALHSTAQKIEQITNSSVDLFRAPYGLFNKDTQEIVKESNLKVVNWTIDPYDVKAQTADQIIRHIEQQNLKGSIINLPESSATIEALPTIIKLIQQQNLKLVKLQ